MFQKNQFGERLLSIRQAHGENQEELGKLIGVSRTQISEMENGKKTTTVEKLSIICRHYNVSSDYLLGLTDNPRPYQRKKEEQ